MAVRIVETRSDCPPRAVWFVYDDGRHMYLGAGGRWCVMPWYFESAQQALEAIQARHEASPNVRPICT